MAENSLVISKPSTEDLALQFEREIIAEIIAEIVEERLTVVEVETATTEPVLLAEVVENLEQPMYQEKQKIGIMVAETEIIEPSDPELIIEISEMLDESIINIEQDEQAEPLMNVEIELDVIAEQNIEIDTGEQFKQAALLWAEEWVGETDYEYLGESEVIEETPKTLFEILPITTEELVEKLETLPELRLEEATAIMELVIQTVKRIEQGDEKGETDVELVTAGLEHLVERFLTCLEIEHDETHVITLVQAILEGSIELSFDNFMALQDEGTHERKYISAWITAILNQPIVNKKTDHSFIGKYVLSLISMTKFQLSYS